MTKQRMTDLYFEWLCELVNADETSDPSYSELLRYLFLKEFIYILPMDGNRYEDGIDLRYRFGDEKKFDQGMVSSYLDQTNCSVLEMLVALSKRCDESIMYDSHYGDRTGLWFWNMIENLKLDIYVDGMFDLDEVNDKVDIFLERNYKSNGEGGLFTVADPPSDMRNVEIWVQMCWHLNDVAA